jgi:predicted nucleotidyltransferase component of viral defense system
MSEVRNLPASFQQRLLNHARLSGRPYNEVLQYFVIERFLYRLSKSEHAGQFILKGALMFLVWETSLSRSTRDIDFLGFTSNEIQSVEEIFKILCGQEVEPDGLIFDPQSVQGERIKEDAAYEGVRVRLMAHLGQARIPLQVDIGFADIVSPGPQFLDYPSMLQMPSPHLRGYSRESVIAEKLQALVYLGSINSRMKDFYDIRVLSQQFEFNGATLQEAIRQTFHHRETAVPHDIPTGLSDQFAKEKNAQWLAFLKRTRIDMEGVSFEDVIKTLGNFLLPVLQSSVRNEVYSASWKPGGPWITLD